MADALKGKVAVITGGAQGVGVVVGTKVDLEFEIEAVRAK